MQLLSRLLQHRSILFLSIGFGLLYGCISLVNHYFFRTATLDLGLYTNALYDYAHFQWNDSSTFRDVKENLLADHFDLYLPLWSPLSWIFGTYTLLVVQILALLMGGWGVYLFFLEKGQTKGFSALAAAYFYCFFGVFSALAFDYHSNVVAAALLPWFFLKVEQKRYLAAGLWLLFLLAGKENLSLWLFFVLLGLLVHYRAEVDRRKYLLVGASISLLWFVAVTGWVMPAFSAHGAYPHFHYSILGSGPQEALLHLISHPLESLKTLFINHNHHPQGNYVKAELWVLLLVSGGWLLLRKPAFLLMLLPIFGQKLFHDNPNMWGIGQQYSIEFAPIFALGIFLIMSELHSSRLQKLGTWAVVILALAGSFRIMDHTEWYTPKANIRFYQESHYSRDFSVQNWHNALKITPKEATVSAQSAILPHLALRDHCYLFPKIDDAHYVVLSPALEPYPADTTTYNQLLEELQTNGEWQTVHQADLLLIFKRNTATNDNVLHPNTRSTNLCGLLTLDLNASLRKWAIGAPLPLAFLPLHYAMNFLTSPACGPRTHNVHG